MSTENRIRKIEIDEFKALAFAGGDIGKVAIAKALSVEVIKSDAVGDSRVRRFVASDGSVDRHGDTIDQDGWELDNYRSSGAFLWAHNSHLPPIGKPENVSVEDGKLILTVEFTPNTMRHPLGDGFGDTVMQMYDSGFLRGVSVGFRPLEWKFNEERGGSYPTDFIKQELLEVSAVPVPANPGALQEAKSAGIDIAPLVGWAEAVRDAGGCLWVPKAMAQDVLDSSGTSVSVSAPAAIDGKSIDDGDGSDSKSNGKLKDVSVRIDVKTVENGLNLEDAIQQARAAEADIVKRIIRDIGTLTKHGRMIDPGNETILKSAMGMVEKLIGEDVVDGTDTNDEAIALTEMELAELRTAAASAVEQHMSRLTGRLPE